MITKQLYNNKECNENIAHITILKKSNNSNECVLYVETNIKTAYKRAFISLNEEISKKFLQNKINFTQMALQAEKIVIEESNTSTLKRCSRERYAQEQITLINSIYEDCIHPEISN